MKKLTTYSIAIMGLLIALTIVMTRLFSVETTFLRVSLGFVPQVMMGILFGPLWSGIGGVLADFIGITLLGKAPFFIGFTISAFVEGSIYGWFLYKKNITWQRTIICVLVVFLVSRLFLTPLWLGLMYHVPFFSWVIWGQRLLSAAISFPIQVAITYLVAKSVPYKRLLRTANLFK
ncbi:folate family ECF transporter S component [Enterococcus sp. LJL120]